VGSSGGVNLISDPYPGQTVEYNNCDKFYAVVMPYLSGTYTMYSSGTPQSCDAAWGSQIYGYTNADDGTNWNHSPAGPTKIWRDGPLWMGPNYGGDATGRIEFDFNPAEENPGGGDYNSDPGTWQVFFDITTVVYTKASGPCPDGTYSKSVWVDTPPEGQDHGPSPVPGLSIFFDPGDLGTACGWPSTITVI
jgi:hypothetical protein